MTLPPNGPAIDLAVGVGASGAAQEETLQALASTGYVACGAPAGDALAMGRAVRRLVARGLALGAQLSYPGAGTHGEQPLDLEDRDFQDMVLAQVGGLAAIAGAAGSRVAVARCHSALGGDVAHDERTAQVLARTLYRFDPRIALACAAGSAGARVARDCGLHVIEEVCLGRGYDAAGRMLEHGHPQALCTGPTAVAAQLLGIARDRRLATVDGGCMPLRADSCYLPAGTADAGPVAEALLTAVRQAGLRIVPAAGRRNARQGEEAGALS